MPQVRGAIRKFLSFEEKQKRKKGKIKKLRQKRIRAEAMAALSEKEQDEIKRIRAARGATKSRAKGLKKFARKVFDDPEANRAATKFLKASGRAFKKEVVSFLEAPGIRESPRRRKKRRFPDEDEFDI